MKSWIVVAITATFASQVFAGQIDKCAESVSSMGRPGFYIHDLGATFLPSEKNGKSGFYLLSEGAHQFCELPAQPADSNSQYNYYYLETTHLKKKIYLTYSDLKEDPLSPGIGYGVQPAEALAGAKIWTPLGELTFGSRYVKANCQASTGEATDVLYRGLLKSKIQSTVTHYLKENEYMIWKKRRNARRERYSKALNECAKVPSLAEVSRQALYDFGRTAPMRPPGGDDDHSPSTK